MFSIVICRCSESYSHVAPPPSLPHPDSANSLHSQHSFCHHEPPECLVRALRQEPPESDCLRVVHVHRAGNGGFHLRVRGDGKKQRGWERVAWVRCDLDGEREGEIIIRTDPMEYAEQCQGAGGGIQGRPVEISIPFVQRQILILSVILMFTMVP